MKAGLPVEVMRDYALVKKITIHLRPFFWLVSVPRPAGFNLSAYAVHDRIRLQFEN